MSAELVRVIAEALAEDEVTDGHRWDAERVLAALERAGYRIEKDDPERDWVEGERGMLADAEAADQFDGDPRG